MKKSSCLHILLSLTAILFYHSTALSQILFKVEKEDMATPAFLFGTHHLASPDIVDSIPRLREIIDNTGRIVGEVDLVSNPIAMAATLQQYMTAPADSTLSKVLSDADYAATEALYKKYSPTAELPMSMFDGMKPMALATIITVGITADKIPGGMPEQNIDTYLQTEARQAGKKTEALETVEQQAEFLYGESIDKQARRLADLARNPNHAMEMALAVTEAYFKRDIASILTISAQSEEDSDFFHRLLTNRNKAWLCTLPDIIDKGDCLIAVGALHLAGPDGIVAGLENAGYTVTPIY